MPVTRYHCPLTRCSWSLDHTAADDGPPPLRSLRAIEASIGEHVDTHTTADFAGALLIARDELAKESVWSNHWKYRAIGLGLRLHHALEQHQSAMDSGGIATGRCTCGEVKPCATRRAAGVGEPCRCAPDCPARHIAAVAECTEYGDTGACAGGPCAHPTAAQTSNGQAVTAAMNAAMERLRETRRAYDAGDAYGARFVPGLSRAVEVVQRVMFEQAPESGNAAASPEYAERAAPGDDAWGSVWLHANWEYLTRSMSSEAREDAAAAVLRWMHAVDAADGSPAREEPDNLRWWLHR